MDSLRAVPRDEIIVGERFQALADVILIPRALALRHGGAPLQSPAAVVFDQHRDLSGEALARVARAVSLSIYSPALKLFQEQVWPRLEGRGYVLITHNGDVEVGAEEIPFIEASGDKLGHWFCQNLSVDHPKLSPLPIGLANSMWEHGDVDALCAVAAETRAGRPVQLLHARFDSRTHPERACARAAIDAAFPGLVRSRERQPYRGYLRDLAAHRFCACPRGNGLDTHRFWESQYLGVVPVVKRSAHTEIWARRGVAMVVLDDWGELSV